MKEKLPKTEQKDIYRFGSKPWIGEKIKGLGKTEVILGLLASGVDNGIGYLANVSNVDEEFTKHFGNIHIWPEPGVAAIAISVIGALSYLTGRTIENGSVNKALANKYRKSISSNS